MQMFDNNKMLTECKTLQKLLRHLICARYMSQSISNEFQNSLLSQKYLNIHDHNFYKRWNNYIIIDLPNNVFWFNDVMKYDLISYDVSRRSMATFTKSIFIVLNYFIINEQISIKHFFLYIRGYSEDIHTLFNMCISTFINGWYTEEAWQRLIHSASLTPFMFMK